MKRNVPDPPKKPMNKKNNKVALIETKGHTQAVYFSPDRDEEYIKAYCWSSFNAQMSSCIGFHIGTIETSFSLVNNLVTL